jgi:predicted nucleic acid-binding protein
MAERRIFLDTSGVFAWINARDAHHQEMLSLPRDPRVRLFVTDYIIDEACSLFVARGISHRRRDLLDLIQNSRIVQLQWVGHDLFWKAWDWLQKYQDHPLSLTDCTSFAIMKSLNLTDAATTDAHFRIVGFHPLFI